MKHDPIHQENLKILMDLDPIEIRRRLEIQSYTDPEYIASEVLASFIRLRYGGSTGVLGLVVNQLNRRITKIIQGYFNKNGKWQGVVSANNVIVAEATSYAWERLCTDKSKVSLSENRFLVWAEKRVLDFLKSQITNDSQIISNRITTVLDKDGNETPFEDLLFLDETATPVAVCERFEVSTKLRQLMLTWEPCIRQAVYFRLICRYNWEMIAELLYVTKPTARKYFNTGIERLKGANND